MLDVGDFGTHLEPPVALPVAEEFTGGFGTWLGTLDDAFTLLGAEAEPGVLAALLGDGTLPDTPGTLAPNADAVANLTLAESAFADAHQYTAQVMVLLPPEALDPTTINVTPHPVIGVPGTPVPPGVNKPS